MSSIEITLALLALTATGSAGAMLVRSSRRMRRRLERLSTHAAELASGKTPTLVPGAEPDAMGDLERNMATLTKTTSLRAREAEAESARQKLDGQVQRALAMAEVEDEALDVASRAFGLAAPGCATELLLSNESESELHLAAVSATGAPGCPVATSSSCVAMRSGQTMRFTDIEALDICPHLRRRPGGAKPAACIPIAPSRGASGVLHATADEPIDDKTVARLEVVAAHVGSRLRVLHVLSDFQTQAETDALTGLLNRRSFEQRITGMVRSNRSFGIAICDLDHFKKLNDTHGHAAGDQALRVFARAARSFASERSGLAARLGGEEFVLVLPVSREHAPAASLAVFDEMRTALRRATGVAGGPGFTVSIGLATYPAHGSNLGELLAAADRALYQAKSLGRDRAVFHGCASSVRPPTTTTTTSARPGDINALLQVVKSVA